MTSKLSQMQARFQQRQMAEKEEKLLKLYEIQQQKAFDKVNRSSAGSNSSLTNITTGNGKVRQMFDERRQKAGIDRSYPLEPLSKTMPAPSKTTRGASMDRRPLHSTSQGTLPTKSLRTATKSTTKLNGTIGVNGNTNSAARKTLTTTGLYSNNNDPSLSVNPYSKDMVEAEQYLQEHEDLVRIMNKNNINDDLEDEEMPRLGFDDGYDEDIFTGKLANVGGKLPSEIVAQPAKKTPPPAKTPLAKGAKPSIRKPGSRATAAPGPGKPQHASPPATGVSRNTNNNNNTRSESSSSGNSSKESTPVASPAKTMSRATRPPQSGDAMRAPSTTRGSARPLNRPQGVQRDDLTACRYCQRRFQADRIEKHEDICGRTAKKKRKVYDSTKHRVAGTEVEPYAKKALRNPKQNAASNEKAPSKQSTIKSKPATTSKTGWRQKHEEFIAAIRAAKQVQAHLAKGGDIRDLPPPPPSTNPDYVQCPHCGRRFNEAAAARHIPKCATFQFNKPKPGRK